MPNVALDAHKDFSLFSVESENGGRSESIVRHRPGAIADALSGLAPGSAVALECVGSWYWMVDEIERAGMSPRLVNAFRAHRMTASTHKTDVLDARGLNRLQRSGTLPTVWISPPALRDLRDLSRTRASFARLRARCKHRATGALGRHGLTVPARSPFTVAGRAALHLLLPALPPQARFALECTLRSIDSLGREIRALEARLDAALALDPGYRLLRTIPGLGPVTGAVAACETGDIRRFATPGSYLCYAGLVPRVFSSGGTTRHGRLVSHCNRALKWAWFDAAVCVSIGRRHHPDRHAVLLYERVAARRGRAAALGAVARHLAEAGYWMLRRGQCYRDPATREEFCLKG
jgi:transposase